MGITITSTIEYLVYNELDFLRYTLECKMIIYLPIKYFIGTLYSFAAMPSLKMQKMINSLLHNKVALYVTLVFTAVNIFGYMMSNCTYTVAFFALTAFVTSKFTKNMILILGGSLVITNTFMVCKVAKETFTGGNYVENFEGKEGSENNESPQSPPNKPPVMQPKAFTKDECKNKKGWGWKDDKCIENENKKESMTTGYKKNDRLDYASTVEEAYSDLDNILGADGIQSLTKDTQNLVNQQQQMMKLVSNMGPMVGQVKEMMQSMGGSEGMTKLLSGFAGGSK